MSAPYYYDYINSRVSTVSPNTIHCNNTALQNYFARYYLQRAMSVFEWKVPEWWDKDYIKYVAYTWGYIAVFNAQRDGLGVIPQNATLSGYNIYYMPRRAIISNPALSSTYDLEIGTECSIIKLQSGYCGIMDIVNYYADMAAMCAEAEGVNIFNSKLGYVFFAEDKAAAEKSKKMFDKISSGNPMTVVGSLSGKDFESTKNWDVFNRDIKSSYIVDLLQDSAKRFEMEFDTLIGIPNANTSKKERLITDEVRQNDFETKSIALGWLESLQDGIKKTIDLFPDVLSPENLSVDWRPELKNQSGGVDDGKIMD